jgi:hypothetical protein
VKEVKKEEMEEERRQGGKEILKGRWGEEVNKYIIYLKRI